ncbi:MAG TPA: hypothetical protein VFU89_07395 [Rhabdochlamydiaceae bacterium]|nr:hypothetical protein [Rhabdochlamydiaceae bacterium]
MVTKSGELKTYYQRNWEDFQGYISGDTLSAGLHIGSLALPIIALLHKPAGKAISYIATSLNTILTGRELWTAKTWSRAHAWSILKNGAEFIGTVASLRIGLAIHAAMNLGESLYTLPLDLDTLLTWDGTGKVIRVASNALYLLTLVNFSNPVVYEFIFMSLMLQVVSSLRKAIAAYEKATSWKEMKIVDAAAHAATMLIYMAKIPFAWKLSNIHPRTFVLMRPASQSNKINVVEGLPQITKESAESVVPAALREIAEQNGKEIMFFTSSATHPDLTRNIGTHEWAAGLQRFPAELFDSQWMQSPDTQKWFENYQENQKKLGYIPPKIHWINFSIEERQIPSPDAEQSVETSAEVASRVDNAIRKSLRENSDGDWPSVSIPKHLYLPVFALNDNDMTAYLKTEISKNPELPANIASGIDEGSLRVVTMEPDDLGEQHVTHVVDPKAEVSAVK